VVCAASRVDIKQLQQAILRRWMEKSTFCPAMLHESMVDENIHPQPLPISHSTTLAVLADSAARESSAALPRAYPPTTTNNNTSFPKQSINRIMS
jgi:hypothetical protein